ncbi:MAG: hypothetical protein N2038_14375 [Geminicoccaceae bacterium]|nr:hypothetical protein [Geminicoccaceae bacterium]MCS7268052.1 hypothetical protein [Geminicoccaceae bacterium]MCX7631417.1 hypothetical protein [Geminicoccaceae bacterium]MDW8124764.1 hypothetical protein [Geminicoccaceae bacterium]MDW8342342.1 hypothetical protein [Geminicoccaceae bacterium]
MRIGSVRLPASSSLLSWLLAREIVGRAEVTLLLPPVSAIFARLVAPLPSLSCWTRWRSRRGVS